MNLVPRSTVFGPALPTNSTGTPRPLLAPARPFLTVHYTGSGSWLDPDDTPTELRAIQAYAKAAGKPWEYNYVIDGQGLIFEYAGDYRAAHTAAWNADAIGVLLLVGFDTAGRFEQPTVPMTVAFRDLRAWLVTTGRLSTGHQLRQHRQMPGAATQCPGAAVIAKWDQFAAPVPPPPRPPVPAPPMGADMSVLDKAVRVWDSRPGSPQGGNGKHATDETFFLSFDAVAEIPDTARGAVLNVTVLDADGPGFLVAFGGGGRPETSNVNYDRDEIVSNLATVRLDQTGVYLYTSTACNVIADLQGWST